MSDPHIVTRTPYSPAVVTLTMSDDSTLYGCAWPGCNYAAESPGSIGSHHKTHTGQAAQRRRAQRRPRTATDPDTILATALALLDRVQDLVDLLDSWEAEHEQTKAKAKRWDDLLETLKDSKG